MVGFFPKKIPKIFLFSEMLDAESFKAIAHMLAWDALKKVKKNCLSKKKVRLA